MTYQYVRVSMSGSSGMRLKCRPSSLVTHAIVTMTRLASTDRMWKANSKACHGASNLYGLQQGISAFVNQWNYILQSSLQIHACDVKVSQRSGVK